MAASESKLDLPAISDLPPESFWVSSDDEQDWFNRNAVMQRKTSLKFGVNRNFNSDSHRFGNRKLSTRPSVFGVPNAKKSSGFHKNQLERKPRKLLFRSRSEPGGKNSVHLSEPGSPRVSCTGRVGLKNRDGNKTGFSRLLSSLFGAGTGKSSSRKRGKSVVGDRPAGLVAAN